MFLSASPENVLNVLFPTSHLSILMIAMKENRKRN
jgi:hypothetical protein